MTVLSNILDTVLSKRASYRNPESVSQRIVPIEILILWRLVCRQLDITCADSHVIGVCKRVHGVMGILILITETSYC